MPRDGNPAAEGSERERHLVALHEIAVASSGLLDPDALGVVVTARARALLGGDEATLLWWEPAIARLRILADTYVRPFARTLASGEGSAGMAFETGQAVVIEDYPAWEHAVVDAVDRGMQSVVAVPLMVRKQSVGALTVSFNQRRAFPSEDLRILSLMATQVAPALEAARLHEAMREMSAELEQASQAKSRFLASMSHELRTPLNSILGFSELLIDDSSGNFDPAKRLQFLNQIHTSGQHLLALINDILDLAKVEAGQMELRPAEFDLIATVKAAVDLVLPLARQKHLDVRADLSTESRLTADEGKVRQMLLNLLSNAIKFTPAHGLVSVEVDTREEQVTVSVTDTGIGIAEEDQKRLFVEFQQLGRTGAEDIQGTGLGLALTKRFAELHGGRVWVESRPGAGSRFSFSLPRRVATQQDVPTRLEAEANVDGPLVMVVEDLDSAAALLSIMLSKAGYRVRVVKRGDQVLDLAKRLQPHAITLDVMLPEVDGWEILRALKATPETGHIPVLIVSVLDDISLGLALGADDYLVKPVARQALLTFMTRHGLSRKRDHAATILAVDDDPLALQLLRDSLEPQFTVLTAAAGKQGLDLARSQRPDAVILDLNMPGMNGFELADALKSDSATRDIPILVLTGENLSQAEKLQLNAHVSSVVRKGASGAGDLVSWLQAQSFRDRP